MTLSIGHLIFMLERNVIPVLKNVWLHNINKSNRYSFQKCMYINARING